MFKYILELKVEKSYKLFNIVFIGLNYFKEYIFLCEGY